MNSFVAFIVKDLLGQASILIAFIAMLGLILQKKSPGKTAEGTFKTLLGFLIMMAGINIIVATLTFLNDIFTRIWHERLYYRCGRHRRVSESGIRFGGGADAAGDLCRQYYYRPADAAEIYFLTGQALLWMATIGAVIGYKSGLTGVPLILTGASSAA